MVINKNLFNSFIPLIMMKTLRFKYSVLVGTHTLLDKWSRVGTFGTPI